MSGQSQGAQSKMAYDASTFDTSSEPNHFIRENLRATYTHIDDGAQAIRGSRSHIEERDSDGLIHVRGSIVQNIVPDELDLILPRIMGTAESNDVFALAETVPYFNIMIDRVAKVHTYTNCKIDKAVFRGTKGQPIQLESQIVGQSESEGAAASFPSLTFSVMQPYVFNEGVLVLGGVTHLFDQFVCVIDNHAEVEHNNSRTATDIVTADRTIALALSTPYTSTETGLFTTPVGSIAGIAATLKFTKGEQSLLFTFGNIKSLARTPTVPGKRQIRLPLQYKAFKTGVTDELVITHDSTA
jgi:hypothetical protein